MNQVEKEPLGEIEQAVEDEIEKLAKETVEDARKPEKPGPILRKYRSKRNQTNKTAAASRKRNRRK